MLEASQLRQFESEGYLVARGLLDPKAEIAALEVAYQDLIETLALIHFAQAGAEPPPAFRERPLGERFALMQGASGGHAVEHLDPIVSAFSRSFRRRGDLPYAQIPELFQLMRAAPLLDALESLLGPEIEAAPLFHLNFKLAAPHLALSRETASRMGQPDPTERSYHAFHVGETIWHRDSSYVLPDCHDSGIVTAWIPITEAGAERGSLSVIPGSHRDRGASLPAPEELRERSVELAARPGDVVFFDHWLVHGATPNQSACDVRWAFNFRYLPRGRAAGRPYLPSVLLRSRSDPQRELRNPLLWAALWQRALDHLAQPTAATPLVTDLERAQAITLEWRQRVPDELAWLRLAPGEPGDRRGRRRRRSRRLMRALRDLIAALRP